MSEQPDLLAWEPRYPETPGFRRAGTSEEAARAMAPKAGTLRAQVLTALKDNGPMTVHELAESMGRTVPSVQPRFSELEAQRLIEDSGDRRPNASGKRAIVWKAT